MKLFRRKDIVSGLEALGLSAGDSVIVHSSFRSLGPVSGKVPTFIRALMDVITPDGIIMMPVFNHPEPVWDIDDVQSVTGAVTEVFRQQHDTLRSVHPTHSVAVWGADAGKYIVGHLDAGALSVGSPMHRLAIDGCKTVCIGTTFRTLSLIHIAESIMELPYLSAGYPSYNGHRHRIITGETDCEPIEFIEKEYPGDSSAFERVEERMRSMGQLTEGVLLNAHAIIASGKDVLDVSLEMLMEDPAALLCAKPGCRVCPGRREMLGA